MTLYHVIVSMLDDKISKVQCNTCRSVHGFRDPSIKGAAKKKSTGTRKRTPAIPVSQMWKEQLEKSVKKERAYSIREVFEIGDILDHVKFGIGIVQEVKDGDKIEVMFENDIKTLVHKK